MLFLMTLKISDFCQKFDFWVFWEATGHSGILKMSVFVGFWPILIFLIFLFFLDGLKILAGGYGAVLVDVSMMQGFLRTRWI